MIWKSAFLATVCLACLVVLVKNQLAGSGATLAFDTILASVIFACILALAALWKLRKD
ncbi:hypothetical protein ACN2XU_20640 [Primorskyibacter sp. 2E107]|uniref:hypothetical protein n=1 Tax=Primorskyibacter sp. 2E107 TaxID=3403458 RepID=UPI003AF6C8DB